MLDHNLKLAEPLTLPCGLKLPNRVAKAALAENWADRKRLPPKVLVDTYALWGEGGWGMIITGNMAIDVRQLGTPGDTSIDDKVPRKEILASWKNWAARASGSDGTPVVMQLNHPGRQSPIFSGTKGIFEKSIAPSPVPLSLGDNLLAKTVAALVFGTPKEMDKADISRVVSQFATAAALAAEAGFAGVEIHAAHGYLLSQFLSPVTNQRQDEYGCTPQGRAKIVVEVIHAIRKAVSEYPKFCVGIKFNSADVGNSHLDECIEQLKDIRVAGVDFLEISGGTYEDPTMMEEGVQIEKAESTSRREAFFLEFAQAIRPYFLDTPLMVTGGFRSRRGIEAALREGACDLIGLGRPAVLNPSLPKDILLNKSVEDQSAVLYARRVPLKRLAKALGIKGLTGGAETEWYQRQMHRMLRNAVSVVGKKEV